jgi:hypothetical protein
MHAVVSSAEKHFQPGEGGSTTSMFAFTADLEHFAIENI